MQISNSMWVVDKAGKLALVDSIEGDWAIIRYLQSGVPRFGELTRIQATDLSQATLQQLPPDHGMAPGELEALGYVSATAPAPAAPVVIPPIA